MEVVRCFILKRRVLLFSVLIVCLLPPGCSTIPSRERVGSLAISKARDAVVHAGGRYLQKKTSGIKAENQVDTDDLHPSSYSESIVQTSTQTKYFDAMSFKSRARPIMNMALSAVSTALGWERIKPKADYPSDLLVKFFAGSSISDYDTSRKRKYIVSPMGRYHDRRVFLGLRLRF